MKISFNVLNVLSQKLDDITIWDILPEDTSNIGNGMWRIIGRLSFNDDYSTVNSKIIYYVDTELYDFNNQYYNNYISEAIQIRRSQLLDNIL